MRENPDVYAICVYCHLPVFREELLCKGLDGDRNAHLTCWLDHENKQPKADDETPKR